MRIGCLLGRLRAEGLARLATFVIALVAITIVTRDARAQVVVVERREVPVDAGMPLIGAGTVVLSLSTGAALIVAITSTYDWDRVLFVPIAGPWIALGKRPQSSPEEIWARAGLIVDGLAQAAGLAMLIVGTVLHHTKQPKNPRQIIVPIATSGGAGVSLSF